MLSKELVKYQDKLYWVYRKVKSSVIKEGYVNDLKEFWNCDVAVRNRNQNDDIILFLREIPEAVLVD
jgi:hypothetical protein